MPASQGRVENDLVLPLDGIDPTPAHAPASLLLVVQLPSRTAPLATAPVFLRRQLGGHPAQVPCAALELIRFVNQLVLLLADDHFSPSFTEVSRHVRE